jgi:GNAT superfamily N-acetyltransferase
VPLHVGRSGRSGAAEQIEILNRWAPRHAAVLGLHSGDVGWRLRLDDSDLDDTLVVVRDRDEPVAVIHVEPDLIRPVVRADRSDDWELAETLGEIATSTATTQRVSSDAASHGAYRCWLSRHGWVLESDAWAVLYRPLSSSDGAYDDPLCSTLASDTDIADRVAVQYAAFEHSTFTVSRWHQMAAGPGYDARLDLLRRDATGVPVSAATGWSAGPGRTGILEPVGTHRDHVGAGHGRAVTMAVIAALARSGASGVAVQTPPSNVAAIRAYEACGMRVVEHLHAMVSQPTS